MYLFFDTETNGLIKKIICEHTGKTILEYDPKRYYHFPRIVQLGFTLYDINRNLIKEYDQIVYPEDFTIPKEASKIHGITTEIAKEKGISIVQILNDFWDALENTKYLIAHNISYDAPVVYAEMYRHNVRRKIKNKPIKICTKELTINFCKLPPKYRNQKEYKWPTLTELHTKLFNVDFEDAHDAMGDVKAMVNCFWKLMDEGIVQINNNEINDFKGQPYYYVSDLEKRKKINL